MSPHMLVILGRNDEGLSTEQNFQDVSHPNITLARVRLTSEL